MRTRKTSKAAPAAQTRTTGSNAGGRGVGSGSRVDRSDHLEAPGRTDDVKRPRRAERPAGRPARPGKTGAANSASPSKRRSAVARPETAASAAAYRRALTPEIETELAEIAAATGCELIHADWKGGILRLILDRQQDSAPSGAAHPVAHAVGATDSNVAGSTASTAAADATLADFSAAAESSLLAPAGAVSGISLGDCEHVAKLSSAYLDLVDFGQGRYVLEVSSPGLDRQLYRPSDYVRFVGRLARVTYELPPSAATPRSGKRTVVARLAAAGDGEVTLVDEATGERLTLPLETIRLARLEVEL